MADHQMAGHHHASADDQYREMADWLPAIAHLQPPGIDRIQFHRFSPYHQRAADFGLSLAPYPTYRSVYPLDDGALAELAYYFDGIERPSAREALAGRPELTRVIGIVGRWNRLWAGAEKPVLLVARDEDGLTITDTRPGARAATHRLTGLAARIHDLCDSVASLATLETQLAGPGVSEISAVLDDLERKQLLLRQDGRCLALANRAIARIPDTPAEFPGGTTDVAGWNADQELAEAATG